jgi:membrane protein DedA with SNARE-associated domain
MDLWDSFWSAVLEFIAAHGLQAVALIVLLRSAAVPIPVPADLLVVLVGDRAREEPSLLLPAWLLLALSTTVGAVLFYAFVRWIGHGDINHYGRYIGLTNERLSEAEAQLGRRGARAVFVARIVPGLRLAIVAVCGMLRFRWWKFVIAVALGALIYVGLCLAIGYVFGDAVVGLVGDLAFPLGLLEPVLGLAILVWWLVRARRTTPPATAGSHLSRPSRVRVGALAGTLAIAGSTMLVNALVYLLAPALTSSLDGLRGPDLVDRFSDAAGGLLVLLLDSVMFGIGWGVVFALDDGRSLGEWRDWLRGLAFATLPFVLVMLVGLRVTRQTDQSLMAALLLGVTEALRWGAYGVLLGLIYPVLRTRRIQSSST